MRSVHGSSKAWSAVKWKQAKIKQRKLMACYQKRNDKLSELGLPYCEYLKTDEWQNIRSEILTKDSSCLVCGHSASQVHHTDYEWDTLLGLCHAALISLCDRCHKDIEFDGTRKRTLDEANDTLLNKLQTVSTHRSKCWLAAYFRAAALRASVQPTLERRQCAREAALKRAKREKSKRKQAERKTRQARLIESFVNLKESYGRFPSEDQLALMMVLNEMLFWRSWSRPSSGVSIDHRNAQQRRLDEIASIFARNGLEVPEYS